MAPGISCGIPARDSTPPVSVVGEDDDYGGQQPGSEYAISDTGFEERGGPPSPSPTLGGDDDEDMMEQSGDESEYADPDDEGPPSPSDDEDMEQSGSDGREQIIVPRAEAATYRSACNGGANSSAQPAVASSSDQSEDDAEPPADGTSPLGHDCASMPDFTPDLLGGGKRANVPVFNHSSSDSSWVSYEQASDAVRGMLPIRTTVYNLPSDLFTATATSYRDMETPTVNMVRAISVAAIFGLSMTGMSKGIRSGNHSDKQRAGGQDEEGNDPKQEGRVNSYMFVDDAQDGHRDLQMWLFAHEELMDKDDPDKVLAVRIWKFTFDPAHSDSQLFKEVMLENRKVRDSSGLAHDSARFRNKSLVAESKSVMLQMGGMGGGRMLEDHAGTQYTSILNENNLLQHYKNYGGKTIDGDGSPLIEYDKMKAGALNMPIQRDPSLGGKHVLSPEYAFNGLRKLALNAGLRSISTNDDLNISDAQTKPHSYFRPDGTFRVPDAVRGRFFFNTDPHTLNLFDVCMPRPLSGSIDAGQWLMKLYREVYYNPEVAAGRTKARITDHFNKSMTDMDAVERIAHEAIKQVNFDDFNLSDADRKRCYTSYGQMDSKDRLVLEPQQPLRVIQRDTRRVSDSIVAPALQKMQKDVNAMRARELADMSPCGSPPRPSAAVAQEELNTQRFHVTQDLIHLHLKRMEECFKGAANRENIAAGHVAAYDGLMDAVRQNNGSASMAWEQGVCLTADDTSSFAQLMLWLGQFFEIDCKIDGRDYHLMFELFFTCFEPFADVTFLILLCGTKGNGKSIRAFRLMEVFPAGWLQEGGAASAKSGMNGQNEDGNGRVILYDEMINELCDSSGGERLEFWKQVLMNRKYTYVRTMNIKSSDGTETLKTIKLNTPHEETHIMCTNWGPAFTRDGDPNDPKTAMLDRTISMHVRSSGGGSSSTSDFKLHLQTAQARVKVHRFRLFVSLVGITRLCIRGVPAFQPDFALAYRMFDFLDDQVIVKEYNLSPPTPRKAMKRVENLLTMCIMKAVADVFMFQQSAVWFKAGQPTASGKGQPFCITQLSDVIRQLRATPELIIMAFSQSLDHSVGTSYSGFSVMTALCEHLGMCVGDWLKKPSVAPEEPDSHEEDSVSHNDSFFYGSQSEFDRAQHNVARHAARAEQRRNLNQMSNLVSADGMSDSDLDSVLKSLERSRRMTSAYRHLCSQNGNSDVIMDNPIDTIEHVMRSAVRPPDSYTAGSSSAEETDYLPFYSSSILSGILHVNMFYSAENVAAWCSGASVLSGVANLTLGTRELCFSERHRGGPSQYNYAWLSAKQDDGHRGVASDMISSNTTVLNFDIGKNVLRDTLYLLSTSDNTRRCTEKPNLNDLISEDKAFTKGNDGSVFESTFGLSSSEVAKYGGIRIRGAIDRRDLAAGARLDSANTLFDSASAETLPRHPYAGMADTGIQRKLDLLIQSGRFPATLASVSNKVSKCAPIRIVTKGESKALEANTAACIDHTRTLAESIVRCSLLPGMRNLHEPLCGNSSAPPGLCAPVHAHGDAADASDGLCRKLPYSMDIIGISICVDIMQRFYDPDAEEICAAQTQKYTRRLKDDTVLFTLDDIPHSSLRFVGLDHKAETRKLLSLPVRTSPNPTFEVVNVNGSSYDDTRVAELIPNLKLSLGHMPDEDEVDEFLKACQGSRALPNIDGNLFSMETYRDFQLNTMQARGFLNDNEFETYTLEEDASGDAAEDDDEAAQYTENEYCDSVYNAVQDDGLGLHFRIAEKISQRINALVEKHADFKAASKPLAGDRLLSEADRKKEVARRVASARIELINNMPLDEFLEHKRHFAHVKVQELSKLTYHNMGKDAERQARLRSTNKRVRTTIAPPVLSAKEMRCGVRSRGVQDARGRGTPGV